MKLKWNFLLGMDWRRDRAFAIGSLGMCAAFFGCLLVQGVFLGLHDPNLLTFAIMAACWALTSLAFNKGHKLHWADKLNFSQLSAIKWYGGLTDKEKEQLPIGWDDLVREHGDEYHGRIYLASFLEHEARDVIRLYRKKVIEAKIPDHRIELFTTLMQQRQEDLRREIEDREAVEATIAQMD